MKKAREISPNSNTTQKDILNVNKSKLKSRPTSTTSSTEPLLFSPFLTYLFCINP